MLRNYFATAWRSFVKNRAFSAINIAGLAVGIAAFLFISTYVRFEKSYEDYNPNAENVYRITLDLYNESEYLVTDCETHAPMAPLLKDRFPEVVDYLRMYNNDGMRDVRVGDKKFLETGIYFADPSVVNILSLTVLQGDPGKILSEPFQIVISESAAKKFFGTNDVVGQTMVVDDNTYNVSGVIADVPLNTHLKFTVLMSHSTLPKSRDWYKEDAWDGNNEYSYLLMRPGTDLKEFNQKLSVVNTELKEKLSNGKYVAEPLTSIHLHSNKTFEPEANGNIKVVSFLTIIAVFIIIIAWINYMNLSTARAVERAREVGIRKVLGSLRMQLVTQFLSESLIINLTAGILGLTLFQTAMPLFRNLTGLPGGIGALNDPSFWTVFIVLIAGGTLLSGIYPAFVLSSFRPALVLKGKFNSSSHGQLLRKALVTFQFATTIILIIGVSAVYLQVQHLRSIDIGAKLDQTIAVRMPRFDAPDSVFKTRYLSLKNEMLRNANVQSTSIVGAYPGIPLTELSTTSFAITGREAQSGHYEYYWYTVDEDYLSTMGMTLVAGRNFTAGGEGTILINEEAAKSLGYDKPEDAIGAQTNMEDWRTKKKMVIVGVIKNYYQRSPKEEHLPMFHIYSSRERYLTMRFAAGDISSSLEKVQASWSNVFPGEPFTYTFVNEKFDSQYHSDVRFGRVVATFSMFAVVIACLGLFGLSSYTIVQRRKEIGIRKVLGATVVQVVTLLTKTYTRIILTSAVLALPIAWYTVNNWLSGYTTRIALNGWMFVVPVLVILGIALITVGVQTVRTAVSNPVDSLASE